MFNLGNLKLRGRILLGYAVPLLLTTAATSIVIVNAKKVEYQEIAVNTGWELVQSTDRLELLLYKRQSLIRSYLLTGNDSFLQDYENTVDAYSQLIESLEQHVQASIPEQAHRLEQLKVLGKKIFSVNMGMAKLAQAGRANAAIQQFRKGQILILVEQAEQIFQRLNRAEDEQQILRRQAGATAMQSLVISANDNHYGRTRRISIAICSTGRNRNTGDSTSFSII